MRRSIAFGRNSLLAGAAVAALGVAFAVPALAEDKCFDKGTLAYKDCPEEAAPEPKERNGLYIGARGGVVQIDDVTFNNGGAIRSTEYDQGYAAGGVIGFEFVEVTPGVDLRGETEIGYLSGDVDTLNSASGSGDVSALYGYLNLYSDITIVGPIDLVIGGGVGYASVDMNNHSTTALGVQLDDSDGGFAYHLDAGLGADITDSWAVEVLYRYSSIMDVEVNAAAGTTNEFDIDSHQGLAGIRYKF